MPGLYYEQFSVGQTFEHAIRRTVTESDNVLFTAMTHNPAALHLDEEYGKTTEFGQRIVNSLFTLGLMIGISVHETTLGTTVANLGMTDVTIPKPVFNGARWNRRQDTRNAKQSDAPQGWPPARHPA